MASVDALHVGCRVELHDGTKGSVINKSGTWWYVSLDNQAGIAKRQKGKLNILGSAPLKPLPSEKPLPSDADSKLSAAFNEMIARESTRPWRLPGGKENALAGESASGLTPHRALSVALQLKREAVRVAKEASDAILSYDKVMRLAEELKESEPAAAAKPRRAPLGTVKLSNNANVNPHHKEKAPIAKITVAQKRSAPVVPLLPIGHLHNPPVKNNTTAEPSEQPANMNQQWFNPRAARAPPDQPEACNKRIQNDSQLQWILARTHGLHSGQPEAALPASTFKVIREVGNSAGAFGKVYKGVDTRNGQSVAVKKLTPTGGSGEEEILLEICLLEALGAECAQIVNYHGYYQVRKDYYLVLDLYDCSLWHHLFGASKAKSGLSAMVECGKDGTLGPSRGMHAWACERHFITVEVAKALLHMHGAGSHGIMHRDLKPDNVLLSLDSKCGVQRVVLTDFGLSRTAWRNQNRRMSGDIGTVRYMSPEVMRGDAYGRPSDLWSFGVTIYELWTGLPAYEGLSEMQAEQSIMSLGRPGSRGYANELRPLPFVFSLVDQCLIPQGRRIEAKTALEMLIKDQKSFCKPVLQTIK